MRLIWHQMSIKAVQLLAGALMVSCLTPVDIDLQGSRDRMIITGQVSTLPDRTFAQVATSAGAGSLPTGTAGAQVTLVDALGNMYPFVEIINQRNPGLYKPLNFTAVPGITYHIRVVTPRGQFESQPQRVPLQTGTDDISYEFTEETAIDLDGVPFKNKLINVYTTPSIPNSDDPLFVKWTLDEVYMIIPTDFPDPFGYVPPSCYVSQAVNPQRIEMFDGTKFGTDELSRVLIGQRVAGQTFHYRHYFIAYQGSITEDAFDYWTKVKTLVTDVGSVFDSPPSPITGNMISVSKPEEEILGYFQAVNESMKRIFLTRGELPFQLPDYCDYNNLRASDWYPAECLECINVRNSSFERPSWFGE